MLKHAYQYLKENLIVIDYAENTSVPTNLFMYFVTLEIFIIATLSIGTILGLTVKSTSKLTMVSQLIFLPSIMLSGIMFPKDMLPDVLQSIGDLFPATWGFTFK